MAVGHVPCHEFMNPLPESTNNALSEAESLRLYINIPKLSTDTYLGRSQSSTASFLGQLFSQDGREFDSYALPDVLSLN